MYCFYFDYLFQLNDVVNGLRCLVKRRYLVLHGMMGCGKTSLAIHALGNYELIQSCFQVSTNEIMVLIFFGSET